MSFKQQCIELRKKDLTLNEIVKITGRSKTSVYFHIKDISLSNKKKKEVSQNAKVRALKNSAARKGKALRSFKPFSEWTPDLILLVAHLMFDGEIQKKRCCYNNRSESLIQRVEKLMRIVYSYDGNKHYDKRSGVIKISFNNVELGEFLKQKSSELIDEVDKMLPVYQREFLRAFFDDEGCMDYRIKTNKRRVRGYQKDKTVLVLVQKLLKGFAIDATLQGKNEVVISGKENLVLFQKEINFSKGVRLNPNRTNSIWKKDIEKRELLDMAIKSFKL